MKRMWSWEQEHLDIEAVRTGVCVILSNGLHIGLGVCFCPSGVVRMKDGQSESGNTDEEYSPKQEPNCAGIELRNEAAIPFAIFF